MPKPRKLRLASVIITPGTCRLNWIIMGAIILGRICRVSSLVVGQPIVIAACRYTFSLMPITALLITLEPTMPPSIPKVMITDHIPGPIIEIMTIRTTSPGRHITPSTNLCSVRSSLPPMYPDTMPIIVARSILIVVAAKPTIIEIRAPKMTRLSMHRPS
ncbi:hypothetical protein ES703_18522 [subsurface metagenome]